MTGLFNVIRPLLFAFDPETGHDVAVTMLAAVSRHRFLTDGLERLTPPTPPLPVRVMGLDLPHPVGLAAGFDKDARAFPALGALGFSFVETGTVTPQPQAGNPKKRLFRLTEDRAIINRMGFNSGGLERFVARLSSLQRRGFVGVNLGKNASTPLDMAVDDYALGLRRCYPYADYFTLNISSPNTPSLRELQHRAYLEEFLTAVAELRAECTARHGRRVPVAIKIAPDLTDAELEDIARAALEHGIDGIIATNTTITRAATLRSSLRREAGGLSGTPLQSLSTERIRTLYRYLNGKIPIIGVGGIFCAEDAWQKLAAGADTLQIYTGFVFLGPRIVRDVVRGLAQHVADLRAPDLATALNTVRSE